MDRRTLLALMGAGAATAMTHAATDTKDAPVAVTNAGKLRGYRSGKVSVFKGIPYGASTAGSGRFMAPRTAESWSGVRDATQLGDRAPQNPTPGLMPEEAVSVSQEPMSERCLHLNVWTPGLRDHGKRPVMVYFHGGGYSVGSSGNTRYEGTNLCTRQDVVLVTANHRLNVFGHLHLGDLAGEKFADSGNAGMLDIVAALEWIRDNIAEFGGDPGNVTVFGESGGGGKVITLLAMPAAKGLFHRALAQSGFAIRQTSRQDATRIAEQFLKQLGLKSSEAEKLQRVPQAEMLAALAKMSPPPRITPVVDGRHLPAHPFDPAAPAVSENVPLLIGTNATEVNFFADTPLDAIDDATLLARVKSYTRVDEGEAAALIALYRKNRPAADNTFLYQLIASDYWMTSDLITTAERKAAAGKAPVFVYRFEKETPVRKLRSVHSLEIPYVFDNLHLAEVLTGKGPERQALATLMSRAWATFARSGDPNYSGLPTWPAYSAQRRSVIVFDDVSRVVNDPYREERLAIEAIRKRQAGA
jgi:para-nitrobenzyl esterase